MRRIVAPASGIAYALLAAIGTILLVGAEIDLMTDEEILAHYADSGNRSLEAVGFYLAALAVVLFLWFVATLRSRIAPVEGEPRTLSALAFGGGIAGASLFAGGAALLAGTSLAAELATGFVVDPNMARFALTAGYLLLTASVFANCVLIVATSVLIFRTGVLPTWLSWAGFAAVVLAVIEIFLFPAFVIPVWVLVVSVVLMLHKVDVGLPSKETIRAAQ